jgi:hypothetical protein
MWVRSVRRALEKQETPYVAIQSWNKDIILLPTILVCFVFALVQTLGPEVADNRIPSVYYTLGGTWFAVFLLNWIILRFDMKLMWVVVIVLAVVVLVLALQMLGWLKGLMQSIRGWDFYLNSGVYLGLGVIFSIGIILSWLRQQFYFAIITPNETEIHSGIFGKVEKISREQTIFEKNVSEDALEKGLFRMGAIIIRAEVPHNPRTYVYDNVLFIDTKDRRARDIQSEERVTIVTKATADD